MPYGLENAVSGFREPPDPPVPIAIEFEAAVEPYRIKATSQRPACMAAAA
tara:strand:- start:26 stop:175 length:150 start_codon:yes stop_codon:yes gene_type:complete